MAEWRRIASIFTPGAYAGGDAGEAARRRGCGRDPFRTKSAHGRGKSLVPSEACVESPLPSSVIVLVLVVGGVAVGSAGAHLDASDPFLHLGCPAVPANRVDPVNVVFKGWGTWGRAAAQIEAHAGWTVTSGSTLSFVDHGVCAAMHTQRASGHASRFHVRLRGQHWDPVLGWTALAGAHHEDLVVYPFPCGHAVDANGSAGSGFDRGRDDLLRAFAGAGHPVSMAWWGNTQSFKQCDGDWARSDGWTAVIALHQVSH